MAFRIRSKATGSTGQYLYMTVKQTSKGDEVQAEESEQSSAQIWEKVSAGGNMYKLKSQQGPAYLVMGGKVGDVARTDPNSGLGTALTFLNAGGTEEYLIRNPSTNLVLGIHVKEPCSGDRVDKNVIESQVESDGKSYQIWFFDKI